MGETRYFELKNKVESFIDAKKETDEWDFKQEWSDTQEVVKDIICFLNTTHDKDCYLIYGISDDYEITGMKKERKKQSDIHDTIAKIRFSGGVKPEIELETIKIKNIEVDVLIVKNTEKTPIYLEEPYSKLRVGYIYSRVGDRNTAYDKNSSLEIIEKLWKKRFELLKAPLDYMLDKLESIDDWKINDEGYYNKYKPDYSIRVVDEETSSIMWTEFYSYSVFNESIQYYTYEFFYKSSLKKFRIVVLDSGRFLTPIPESEILKIEKEKIFYRYYVKRSPVWKVKEFLYNKNENFEKEQTKYDFEKVILIFESEKEKEKFDLMIAEEAGEILNLISINEMYDYIDTGNEQLTNNYKKQLRTGIVLNKILTEFRNNMSKIDE